jgi:hypothetical protein
VKGIEPSYAAWEAAVLPLNYTRTVGACITPPELSPGASLVLGAFVARNDPPDRFVGFANRSEPIELHPQQKRS